MRTNKIKFAFAVTLLASSATAQQLEPRRYQNVPVGVNALAFTYGFSTGNVLFDSTLPIEDATADVHTFAVLYLRTLDLFGKSAKADVLVPYSSADFEGFLDGEFRTRTPNGFADPRFRLAVNLVGGPALTVPEFASYRGKTLLGASIQVIAPLGQYDPTKLINLGSNRWSFRPEVGLSRAVRKWFLEMAGGVWLFTENNDFFGGQRLEQSPLYFIKGDVVYNFRRGLWLSFNFGLANGGETTIDGVPRGTLQRNSRAGVTLALPLNRQNALKFIYTSGLTTRLGADFDSLLVVYQYTWGGKGIPPKAARSK